MSASTTKHSVFSNAELFKARLLVIGAMVAFALQDVIVKVILSKISVWQMQMLRSITCIVLLVITASVVGQAKNLKPTQWVWPLIRAIFMSGAYVLFYVALPFLSLSQASATFFIGPLLITLLAAVFLGEPIGWRRFAAVLTGFGGVLLIVQPWGEGFSIMVLLPAGAAACYALGVIITRWRCRKDPAFSLSLIHNFVYAVIGAEFVILLELLPIPTEQAASWPALFNGWSALSVATAGLVGAVAVTHTIGAVSSVRAYQLADAAKIAPFEYTYLCFPPLFDLLIWQNPPSVMVMSGMALIACGGILISLREGHPAHPKPQNFGEVSWVASRKIDRELFGTRIQIGFRLSRATRFQAKADKLL